MNKHLRLVCAMISAILFVVTIAFAEPMLTTADLSEEEQAIYNLVFDYIDQGDAKAAALVLADEEQTDDVFALLSMQQPQMLDLIMLEAMNHFDEDGDLLHMMLLRNKEYITDEVFGDYRELHGLERIPTDVKFPVDAYLLDELTRVYERGGESVYILIDLRYWGLIDDEMHHALLEKLNLDYMDDVDMGTYVPRTAYLISVEEMIQYRTIQEFVDEGDAISVTNLMLQGDVSDGLYAYMRKNNGEVLDMVMAESLIVYAKEGKDESIIQLCAEGFISDACFEYYWEMVGCELPEGQRTDEHYEGVDMYLMHEIDMIMKYGRQDHEFLKTLWMSEYLNDTTREFIANYFGGWEN